MRKLNDRKNNPGGTGTGNNNGGGHHGKNG